MGGIVLAAKVTHVPSLMLSENDLALRAARQPAIEALQLLGRRARERGVDTFVVFDTHWMSNFGFHLNANASHRGTYTSPEAPHLVQNIEYSFPGNPEFGDFIARMAVTGGPSILAHHVPTLAVEYGTIVPMHYMNGDGATRVVPVASPLFASIEELRRVGAAVRAAAANSPYKVAVLASGSMSHKLFENSQLGPDAWNAISSEFNHQMDLRVLDLWRERRYREFVDLLPDYMRKCNGEALMADTGMLFGALGWDGYHGPSEQLCPYFPSSGSGQVVVEFHLE